jgi:hypothetical protein
LTKTGGAFWSAFRSLDNALVLHTSPGSTGADVVDPGDANHHVVVGAEELDRHHRRAQVGHSAEAARPARRV